MTLRSATEHIGLARLEEGTELVRIGKPLLPEFAAWRYRGVFKKRYQRAKLFAAPSMIAEVGQVTMFAVGAAPSLWTGFSMAMIASQVTLAVGMMPRARKVCLRVRDAAHCYRFRLGIPVDPSS